MIIEAKPLHKKKKRLKKLSGKMVSNYGDFYCCNNQLYVVERYMLNCINIDPKETFTMSDETLWLSGYTST